MAVSEMRGCGGRCEEIWCLPRGVNLEDRTQRLAPFGNHAGCRTAQNEKLEDWVSGPSVPECTFQLSGFDHMYLPSGVPVSVIIPSTKGPEALVSWPPCDARPYNEIFGKTRSEEEMLM